ncbi:MAG: phosphonate ABC transporter, permease protein PhnE [Tumebacillaceae bacterium]
MTSKEIKKPSKLRLTVILLILAVLYGFSYQGVDADFQELIEGLPNIANLAAELADVQWGFFAEIIDPMLETVQMALIGTTLGALFGIPLILLASNNVIKNKSVVVTARMILNFVRTIPDLLLASLFVAVFGIGPFAGVMALFIFSFGIITKLGYEAVETIDPGPLEAMTSVGANKLQFISFAVVPQALPAFVAHFLYTLEVCVRASAILGYVGAGGIGMVLKTELDMFQYGNVAAIILFTLVIVIIIDTISTSIRERLL